MGEQKSSVKEVREIRLKTNVFFGVGAIAKIKEIAQALKTKGIGHVMIVTGKGSYKSTGAWDYVEKALAEQSISYTLFDQITPNPTVDDVDIATQMGKDAGAQGVIAIGGGSPIDAGKSVAILLANPDKNARQLYQLEFAPEKAVPIVAINLTHGTGTEVNRFAVVSIPEKEYKPAIAYDCIYPFYSIDDPGLTTGLSIQQTRYVSVDAVNHVIEAATTIAASPLSITLAKETIQLVSHYLPAALKDPEDLEARYHLMYASLIAGTAFDNGLLHLTHALEHPLSAIQPKLAHGLGLAMILPAVINQIYGAVPEVLAEILAPIVPGLKGDAAEAETAAKGVEKWLFSVGVTSKLFDEGFTEEQITRLTDLAQTTPSLDLLLSLAPIPATPETIAAIYRDSLTPYTK